MTEYGLFLGCQLVISWHRQNFMKISELKLGHTYYSDTGELLGNNLDYLLTKSDTSFLTVELKICGGYEMQVFSDFRSALEHSRNHNIVYRFIEYTNIEGQRRILVVHNVTFSDKVVVFQNFYGIGSNWKLYVNSKADIVVQHIHFPKIDVSVRFRNFSSGNEFYFDLSCLIYCLTNYRLENEKDIRDALDQVRACTAK